MQPSAQQLSTLGRQAAQARNWPQLEALATALIKVEPRNAEGYFLKGLGQKARKQISAAVESFERALDRDGNRYDAAVELASLLPAMQQHGKAARWLNRVVPALENSPRYLDMAGTAFTQLGMHNDALPLFEKANLLQSNVPALQANLAASYVYNGNLSTAKDLYRQLLIANPQNQNNHYQLSQILRAEDEAHIRQMLDLLEKIRGPDSKKVFLFYAIAKEYEDLEMWDAAFTFLQRGAQAVSSIADYQVQDDVALIDRIISSCTHEWVNEAAVSDTIAEPVCFVTGLPRTGTTLAERILSSHSTLTSIGETYFVQSALRAQNIGAKPGPLSEQTLSRARKAEPARIARYYLNATEHLRTESFGFVEKLPENFSYLGFLARSFPSASLIALNRHPMDACFSLFKQSFFRYAYSLDDLGEYYLAYHRLKQHWKAVLGDRLIELNYEALVRDTETQTRKLLSRCELEFEEACLHFDKNQSAVGTASAAQVREKTHTRSIGRWEHFARHLAPLCKKLESAGIET